MLIWKCYARVEARGKDASAMSRESQDESAEKRASEPEQELCAIKLGLNPEVQL